MKLRILLLLLLGPILPLLALAQEPPAQKEPFPPLPHAVPAPGPEASQFGAHVQRTMTLLATSTKEHRNHVRILVYGQSISEGKWWLGVKKDLETRFPNADLEMVNRALGGHASNYLVREAETDVYPYAPDLVIFHVYGAHTCYEQIIANIRSRTSAEVLMTTDHLGGKEAPDAQGEFHDDRWTTFMAKFIPAVAERYGCEVVDVRPPWKRYVLDNKLAAKDMLLDDIHLADQGNGLYSALIERQLVYRPELKGQGDLAAGTLRTVEVGKDAQWKDGKLEIEFEGNRIVAVAEAGPDGAPAASVLIDGKKSSEFLGCYAFTRTQSSAGKILAVFSEKAPLAEDWTIRVTDVDQAKKVFKFEATGSKTGADGTGTSDARFVSKSGRIVIENDVVKPDMKNESDWSVDVAKLALGADFKFQCVANCADKYVAPAIKDATLEYTVTLAQGLPVGKHTLTLTADGAGKVPLQAIRIYRPAVAAPTTMVYETLKPPKE